MIGRIEWVRPRTGLPQSEATVLMSFSDKSVAEGFFEEGVWRNSSAARTLEEPRWWAYMPEPPEEAEL